VSASKSRAVSDGALKEAKELFQARCAMCHGPDGSGKGPASAGLKPQPRDFGDPAWQDSVTDEHIEKTIERGGLAVGKSPLMPPHPDLAGKPVVKALRKYIRTMRR
jgi:mono/diheme cytochrome c family protein